MVGQPKKILIIEDEKAMARALDLKLKRAGFDVVSVFDGESALTAMRKAKFDLLVLDLVMPKMDGFAVLRELKSRRSKTPVIVMSNLGQAEDMKRAKELGAAHYFVKSDTTIADVVEHIKGVLASP